MAEIERSIVVNAPLRQVFEQWMRFEEFPRFMEDVVEVQRLDPTHFQWKQAGPDGHDEWVAELTNQDPEDRIAWHGPNAASDAAVVILWPLVGDRTEVLLRRSYQPPSHAVDAARTMGLRVERDLERFRALVEERFIATFGSRPGLSSALYGV